MSEISPASSVLSSREKRVALAGPSTGPLRGASGILKGAGYQVAVADDVVSLERLEGDVAPDLVIFDIACPPEGGVAASRQLRARPFWKFVSIMLATPAGEPHLEEAHVPGINDFILAPFPADELLDKVRRLTVIPARREVNTVAKVRDGRSDGTTLFGKTLNVSATGILIEIESLITIGRNVDVEFFLPDDPEPLHAKGRVIRRTTELDLFHPAFGIRFLEMPENDHARIETFVAVRERAGKKR
jgi:CheY-like chemotaxis protein